MGGLRAAILIATQATSWSNCIMEVNVRGSRFSDMERVTLDASNELSWPPPIDGEQGAGVGRSECQNSTKAARIPDGRSNVMLDASRNLKGHGKPRPSAWRRGLGFHHRRYRSEDVVHSYRVAGLLGRRGHAGRP